MTGSVVLVTGASSGIGALAAGRLAAAGHRVFAASRRGTAPPGCESLVMDVDSDSSVDAGIAHVVERTGRIDSIVLCAGWGIVGAAEDTTAAEARAQFETNFIGAHRVVHAVLPAMRRQQAGRIVLVSSLVADVPIPYQAFYSASKAALSNYAEALRMELVPAGIHVICIEPGNFRTGFTGSRRRAAGWTATSPNAASCEASLKWMEHDELRAPAPDAVVRRIAEVLEQPNPSFRHVVVAHGAELVGAWLRALLPYRLYETIALKVFRVR
jgi:NAD(P)-dependent dehydrogenase (short-subunit alcohol dehydrogenase family)